MQELAEHTSGRWCQSVVLFADEENDRGDQEEDGRQKEGEPEANILLGIDHADLTDEGAGIDHEVEIKEDAGIGDSGIDNDALTSLRESYHSHSSVLDLLSEEGRHVCLEESGTKSKCDESNDERSQGDIRIDDNRWSSRCNQNNVGYNGNTDGDKDSLESAKVSIGDVGSQQRHDVCPKLVEEDKTRRCLLTFAECT